MLTYRYYQDEDEWKEYKSQKGEWFKCDAPIIVNQYVFKKENGLIYSFDSGTKNFHAVSYMLEKEPTVVDSQIACVQESIKKVFESLSNDNGTMKVSGGNIEATREHRYNIYNEADNRFEFLIVFGRLSCNDNIIEYTKNKIQFYKYRVFEGDRNAKKTNVNWYYNKEKERMEFDMMYPNSGIDGAFCYNAESNHCIYNPLGLSINSEAKDISEEFLSFIKGETCFDGNPDENNHIYGKVKKHS